MSCVQAPSVTLGRPRLLVRGLVAKIATDIPQNGCSSPPAKKHKAGAAEERATDPSKSRCLRSHPRRWRCHHLGHGFLTY